MENDLPCFLRKFYDKLLENFLFEQKLKQNSILISMMEVKSNIRYRILIDSSLSIYEIPKMYVDTLLVRGYIAESDEPDTYVITAQGVWMIEKKDEQLIDFIHNKFFHVSLHDKKLTDKEKLILFSMITARTFSHESCMDLKKDDYALEAWERIIDSSYHKLVELGVIRKMNVYGKSGNEHKISHFVRHTDLIPKKTKGIFTAPGNQKYFLNVATENNLLMKDKISYVLSLIFDSEEVQKYEKVFEIDAFCKELSYQEAPYLFKIGDHIFTTHEYDDVLSDAIRESILIR